MAVSSTALGRGATERPWLKPAVFVACLLPLALLVFEALREGLGANPVETITRWSGEWALRFLVLTLAMTPLRRLGGWRWPLRIRRMLGLYTFFYACLHFLTFVWFDHDFSLAAIGADILKRPYVTVGFLGLCLLLVLAVTSNDYSVRRLRRNWQTLHRAVYLIAVLAMLHFAWLVKADYAEPAIYLGAFLLLFGYRVALLLRQ